MSSSKRARQISAISEALKPLDGKARGMPLDADEWNVIIGVLRDLLKINKRQDEDVAGRLDQRFAVVGHEHLGQVTLAWLDVKLQARLAEGGDGISTRQALAKMRASLDSMQAEVARLTGVAEKQQSNLDRVEVGQLVRSRNLDKFEKRFGGLENLETSVAAIASSQGALRENFDTVLALRQELTDDNGDAINVASIASRLTDLESVRESLTGIDGTPLRLRDLQLELKNLSDGLSQSAGGGREGRLADLEAGFVRRFLEIKEENVTTMRTELAADIENNLATLNVRLDDSLAAERVSLIDRVGELNTESEGRSSALIERRLNAERGALDNLARETAISELDTQLAGLSERIDRHVAAQIPAVTESLRDTFAGTIDTGIVEGLEAVEGRLDGRIDGLSTSVQEAQNSFSDRIKGALADISPAIEAQLMERLNADVGSLRGELSTMISDSVRVGVEEQMPALREAAIATVNDGLGDIDQRIKNSVTQSTAVLEERFSAQLKQELRDINISGSIASATADLESVLRTEVANSISDLQVKNNRAINNAMTSLRGELTTGRPALPIIPLRRG